MKSIIRICIHLMISILFQNLSGQEWQNYTAESHDLASNHINSICVDGNGIKWFGTDSGLCRFDGNSFHTFQRDPQVKQTLANNNVNDIAFEVTSYGPEIWLATDNGVSVVSVPTDIDAMTFATPYRTDSTGLISNRVNVAMVDSNHVKWFGTDQGVSTFTGSEWSSYTVASEHLNCDDISAIGLDNYGGWRYMGTHERGVSRLRVELDGITSASAYLSEWTGLPSDTITSIHILMDGTQWFGTNLGAAYHDTTTSKPSWTWHSYFQKHGLADNRINVITEDHQGTVWFGTPQGVSSFNGEIWQTFTTGDGLVSNNVLDIGVDLDGSLWFATDHGLSHYTGNNTIVKSGDNPVSSFRLCQNYPNPFNPKTTIQYTVPSPCNVQLKILDILGREIDTIVNKRQQSGNYQIIYDGTHLSSGLYLYQIRAGNFVDTKKLMMIK